MRGTDFSAALRAISSRALANDACRARASVRPCTTEARGARAVDRTAVLAVTDFPAPAGLSTTRGFGAGFTGFVPTPCDFGSGFDVDVRGGGFGTTLGLGAARGTGFGLCTTFGLGAVLGFGAVFGTALGFGAAFLGTALGFGAAFLGSAFLGATFLGAAFFGAAFLGATFLGAAFLGAAFLGAAFLGAAFLGAALGFAADRFAAFGAAACELFAPDDFGEAPAS